MHHVIREKKGNTYWIILNRANKKNAISPEMYREILLGLDEANNDDNIIFTIFTGTGEFYSSGNDFSPSSFVKMSMSESAERAPFQLLINELLTHRKVLIALVNGPAIGIACTTLALMDLVIASDQAYFHCPFTEIGLCPEGGSSVTFAKLMGHTKAAQMLLFSEKLSAKDALVAGFVCKLLPHSKFIEASRHLVNDYSKLQSHSVLKAKQLMRPQQQIEDVMRTSIIEATTLQEMLSKADNLKRIVERFTNKAKL